ncbi:MULTISPECIES: C13 family peptidase [unclassified Psychrobacter]|uniref:C13 family peptidase n=1 Tax=unclassified Psychrobacter TaxID=196806 RepID=UPI0025B48396|nr:MULTISPECIES: C13 family peptidase [unclassified Psychrobacter]MDN3452518.1 C13 family peptidase [Psychrobacter sp. APC 3350]MDN3502342.1 C13 family peptidase [Psychrobacter sp. 5A.1]
MSLTSLKTVSLQRFSLNFAANIIATLWMLVGSTRAFSWVKPTFIQFAVFALLALGSNVLFSWLAAENGSMFNEQGLVSYLIWPMIILLGGIILARRASNQTLVFVPVVLWLVADTLSALLQSLVQFFGSYGWLPDWSYSFLPILFLVLFLWQTLALLWIFSRRLRIPWWERIIVLVGAVALLTIWQRNVADQPIFKQIPVEPILEEAALYEQPRLLQQALNSIDPSTSGKTDWYFMGVAGFSDQNVFRSEINKVRELFDVRFGTSGHSLSLINNTYSWLDEPIATKTSILRGLRRIGQQMNADEDVLFLTLSSHGNEDIIQLANPPIEMDNLDATWLREALDASGIRWRVVVVSACYSGSFIDELASPTTVVITASAADKASFGCTNTAEMTYFGQAFFAESLRSNTSFETAFKDASIRVNERESAMGFEPSEPQMVIGSLMETALPAFEQVLFDKARPSVASITNNTTATTVNILPDNANNLSVDEGDIADE